MNIQVENLNYLSEEKVLERLFSHYGRVRAVQIVRDYYKGTVKGFINMPDDKDAEKAASELDGHLFMGKQLLVTCD